MCDGQAALAEHLRFSRGSFLYRCFLFVENLHEMVGVTPNILDLCSPIFQPDFKSVDVPRLKVKPLYAFVEKLPCLALFIEFEVTLLLNEALAGFSIGSYGDDLYMLLGWCDDGTCVVTSHGESKED